MKGRNIIIALWVLAMSSYWISVMLSKNTPQAGPQASSDLEHLIKDQSKEASQTDIPSNTRMDDIMSNAKMDDPMQATEKDRIPAKIRTPDLQEVHGAYELYKHFLHPPKSIYPSSDCGDKTNRKIVIAIISSPSPKGGRLRNIIRNSWLKFATQESQVVARFFLGFNRTGQIPEHLIPEALVHKDMAFVNVTDAYSLLAAKSPKVFQWFADFCWGSEYLLKVDDDTFVRADKLVEATKDLPKKQLVWGYALGGEVIKTPGHRNADTEFPMRVYPPYCSGAGYMLSADVALGIGYPPLPLRPMTNEDASLGTRILPYDVKIIKANGYIAPWRRECKPHSVVLHKMDEHEHDMMYQRVLKGESLCGEQLHSWKNPCGVAGTKTNIVVKCRNPTHKIVYMKFASFGQPIGNCQNPDFSLFKTKDSCHAASSKEVFDRECIGRNSCSIMVSEQTFGPLKCGGPKKALAVAQCEPDT